MKHKKNILLLIPVKLLMGIILLVTISSCATLINSKFITTEITGQPQSKIVIEKDTFSISGKKTAIRIKRKKEPLSITVLHNHQKEELLVPSSRSRAYKLNIWNYGLGLILDYKKDKSYTFPRRIHLYNDETGIGYFPYDPEFPYGRWRIHLSIPYFNHFHLQPQEEGGKTSLGFLGLQLGTDFFYNKSRHFRFSAAAATDFPSPIPVPLDIFGEYEIFTTTFLSLSHHHESQKWNWGYGLTYGENNWKRRHGINLFPRPNLEEVTKSHNTWGLIFPVYYKIKKSFHLGIIYRPTWWRSGVDPKSQYEHLISLDVAWKIGI